MARPQNKIKQEGLAPQDLATMFPLTDRVAFGNSGFLHSPQSHPTAGIQPGSLSLLSLQRFQPRFRSSHRGVFISQRQVPLFTDLQMAKNQSETNP